MLRDKDNPNKTHYTIITNIARLLRGLKYGRSMYYCKKCYCSFANQYSLENVHNPLCFSKEKVMPVLPEKNKNDKVKF